MSLADEFVWEGIRAINFQREWKEGNQQEEEKKS